MKLVRDNIPEKFPQHSYRKAKPEEWALLLRLKVAEEAGEVVGARNREELIEELGDLQTALWALARKEGISVPEVEAVMTIKKARRGVFTRGWILTDYKEA